MEGSHQAALLSVWTDILTGGDGLKRLSLILAWTCLIAYGFAVLRFAVTAIHYALVPAAAGWELSVIVCLTINVLILATWVCLLKRRIWAWKALFFLPVAVAAKLTAYQLLYTARPHAITVPELLRGLPFLVIEVGVPFLVLLTDRPSGWTKPGEGIP